MEHKRLLQLREWEPAELELSPAELRELQGLAAAKLTIAPGSAPNRYLVVPSSVVGAASTPALQVVIEPKLGIDRVFFLLGYSRKLTFLQESVELGDRRELAEAFVESFLIVLQRTLRRGLLMDYRRREDALPLVRGQIRFAEQARRRYGLPLPVEISYDDYTVDTESNRLLKAALRRVSYLRFRRAATRSRVAEALAAFTAVADVSYTRSQLPDFTYTRLTERYRAPLELARLILQNTSIELEPGSKPTVGILVDMNKVFEDFLFAALGEELQRVLPPNLRWRHGRLVTLDEMGHLRPEPDLSLWSGARCCFVGDAKYKTTDSGEAADLYQLLAYCVATGLQDGLLVYAEAHAATAHRVVLGGPRLHVEGVDLTLPHGDLLARCRTIAERIAELADAA